MQRSNKTAVLTSLSKASFRLCWLWANGYRRQQQPASSNGESILLTGSLLLKHHGPAEKNKPGNVVQKASMKAQPKKGK
jgi:hypothetical protein